MPPWRKQNPLVALLHT